VQTKPISASRQKRRLYRTFGEGDYSFGECVVASVDGA